MQALAWLHGVSGHSCLWVGLNDRFASKWNLASDAVGKSPTESQRLEGRG
jgi:hypothetical protein